MLYPLSYRRKARVVYRGEAGVATVVCADLLLECAEGNLGALAVPRRRR